MVDLVLRDDLTVNGLDSGISKCDPFWSLTRIDLVSGSSFPGSLLTHFTHEYFIQESFDRSKAGTWKKKLNDLIVILYRSKSENEPFKLERDGEKKKDRINER